MEESGNCSLSNLTQKIQRPTLFCVRLPFPGLSCSFTTIHFVRHWTGRRIILYFYSFDMYLAKSDVIRFIMPQYPYSGDWFIDLSRQRKKFAWRLRFISLIPLFPQNLFRVSWKPALFFFFLQVIWWSKPNSKSSIMNSQASVKWKLVWNVTYCRIKSRKFIWLYIILFQWYKVAISWENNKRHSKRSKKKQLCCLINNPLKSGETGTIWLLDYELMGKFHTHLGTDFWVQSMKPLFSFGFTLGEKYAFFFLICVITIFMHLACTSEKKTHTFSEGSI